MHCQDDGRTRPIPRKIKKTNTMFATHIYTEEFNTNRKLANRALKAMSDIQGFDNGTIRNPNDLASSFMKDGRTLIQAIYEDGYVMYNDGFYIVEVDEFCLYVDVTSMAINDCIEQYENLTYKVSEGLEPEESTYIYEK